MHKAKILFANWFFSLVLIFIGQSIWAAPDMVLQRDKSLVLLVISPGGPLRKLGTDVVLQLPLRQTSLKNPIPVSLKPHPVKMTLEMDRFKFINNTLSPQLFKRLSFYGVLRKRPHYLNNESMAFIRQKINAQEFMHSKRHPFIHVAISNIRPYERARSKGRFQSMFMLQIKSKSFKRELLFRKFKRKKNMIVEGFSRIRLDQVGLKPYHIFWGAFQTKPFVTVYSRFVFKL